MGKWAQTLRHFEVEANHDSGIPDSHFEILNFELMKADRLRYFLTEAPESRFEGGCFGDSWFGSTQVGAFDDRAVLKHRRC